MTAQTTIALMASVLTAAACGGTPCGEPDEPPEGSAAITRLFLSEDTTSVRFRDRHGIDRAAPGWMAVRLRDAEECGRIHAALESWVAVMSRRSPADRGQVTQGFRFRIYETPAHYVVAVELLDRDEPAGDRTRLVIFRTADLELVAVGLM